MKQILLILNLLFAINLVFAQNTKGMSIESSINDNDDIKNIQYERVKDIGFDKELGKYFRTQYHFFNADDTPALTIAVLNYKLANRIEIYMFPYSGWTRMDDLMQYYVLYPTNFKGLNYKEQLEKPTLNNDGSEKLNVSVSYISAKKEHLIIHQVNTKLYNLHYRID